MTASHDDPAYAAMRACADLPALAGDSPLPPDAGLRTRLLERDAEGLRRTRDMLIDALQDLARAHAALRGQDDPAVRAALRAVGLARLG